MIHSSPVYSREKKVGVGDCQQRTRSPNISIWLGWCSEMGFLGFRV